MLTICSDLDETPNGASYFEISRFLNSSAVTSMGRGLNLEIGNTIYFDMPDNQFAYWNTNSEGREKLRMLIQGGFIDCFHSFGDLATRREQVQRSLDELDKYDCKIECWVDHAAVPTNFGSDIMQGYGDVVGAPAYHADITYAYGVRFVWLGRVTSIIGQNVPVNFGGLFCKSHAATSLRTIVTEAAKNLLGSTGTRKYEMHAGNRLMRPIALRDGSRVFEFARCNPHWHGVGSGATADGLPEIMSRRFLDILAKRRGFSILYTHLGKTRQSTKVFGERTVATLRTLAEYSDRKEILVTTTRRMLGYCLATQLAHVVLDESDAGEIVRVDTTALQKTGLPTDLSGLTIYVRDAMRARFVVDGQEVAEVERNIADETGSQSVSLPWRSLTFPLG
jgi:hypothetical protein